MRFDQYRVSPREAAVFRLIIEGKTLDQIGIELFIVSSTVQDHLSSLLKKTESKNRSQMIARIFRGY